MFRFESLEIWKLAVIYANDIYNLSKKFPREELYALTNQLRRAAVSISNNIAEGSGASTKKEFCLYLNISIRSALETVNILYIARMRNYITEKERSEFYEKAEKLIRKIRSFKITIINDLR